VREADKPASEANAEAQRTPRSAERKLPKFVALNKETTGQRWRIAEIAERSRRRIDGSSYTVGENLRCVRGWLWRGRGDGREDFDGRRDERCVARSGAAGLSRKRF